LGFNLRIHQIKQLKNLSLFYQ